MLALGYSVLSRLAYVLYIGLALRRADAQPVSRDAAAPAYARFRRRAALLMYHDGIAFVAVCLLTRGTLDLPVPPAWRFVGAGLVAAVFSQGAIVAFYRLVERPHYQRLYGGVAATTARRLRTSQEPG